MPQPTFKFADCREEQHSTAILDILNEAILNSTALYDYRQREPAAMAAWFQAKAAGGFPVIGAFTDDGTLAGFASWGTFRAFPAFKYTVEHSVYVHKDYRGCGLGKSLMSALIARARESNVHTLIGCIDATNAGSIALHENLGFQHMGTLPEVGFKFGRWLDASFYQLRLEGPAQPVDG